MDLPYRYAFKLGIDSFPGGNEEIIRLKNELGPMDKEEKWVAIVFALTAFFAG